MKSADHRDAPSAQLRPLAEEDLITIWLYSYERWGELQADLYLEKLKHTFARLAETPQLARERAEFIPPVRIHPCEQHLIVYLAIDNGVDIIRVLHQSMDVDSRLD